MDEQVSSNRAVNMQGGSVWLHLVDGYLEREGNAAAATATAAAAAALRSSDKVSTRPFFFVCFEALWTQRVGRSPVAVA